MKPLDYISKGMSVREGSDSSPSTRVRGGAVNLLRKKRGSKFGFKCAIFSSDKRI